MAGSGAVTPAAAEVLEVYVREGCPHCAAAKVYLREFAAERPWLRVELRPVDEDAGARDALVRVTEQAGYWPPGVPPSSFADGCWWVLRCGAQRPGAGATG